MDYTGALCFLFVFFFLFLSSSAVQSGEWLKVALTDRPVTADPAEAKDYVSDFIIYGNVYETLVRYGSKNRTIEPGLALKWEVEKSGKEWVFTLRKNVVFHDGSEFTADNVVSSVRRIKQYHGEIIKNDRYSVRFILPDARAEFIKTLTKCTYAIVKLIPDGSLVGTGPFLIDEWKPENKVVLKVFDSYWDGITKLEGVIYFSGTGIQKSLEGIKNGNYDLVDMIPQPFAKDFELQEGVVLSAIKGVNLSFVHLNINNPPLDNIKFRRAMNMAINKEKLIKDIYDGRALKSYSLYPVSNNMDQRASYDHIKYNPVEAKRIISGCLKGKDHEFRLIGLPSPRPYCPNPYAEARLVAGYLKGAGMNISYYQPQSMKEYIDIVTNSDYDLLLSGWVIESNNPDDFYSQVIGVGSQKSVYGVSWENQKFDSVIIEARRTISVDKQTKLYLAAEKVFYEECPWIILAHPDKLCAYSKNIQGINVTPTAEMRLFNVIKN